MMERRIANVAELSTFADEILSILPQKRGAHVLALSGDLGAGKTAFTQAFATHLGVREHVVSPTFVIMRTYDTADERFPKLVHIDAYRIENEEEIVVLKIPELLNEPGVIACIEWPEKIPAYIPGDALTITFSTNDDGSRTVTYGKS